MNAGGGGHKAGILHSNIIVRLGGDMNDLSRQVAGWAAAIVEMIGVGIIAIAALFALVYFIYHIARAVPVMEVYHKVRLLFTKGVLFGLEFLVAGDIIYTVAVELTFETVSVLALIVLIRTFLSMTLELEVNGRWPWQNEQSDD